jgi:hypothetical protein
MAEDTKIQAVKLTDGRTVDFPGTRKMQKETFLTDDGKVIARFDFVNGETRSIKLRDDMILKFAGHGALQKIGDSGAGEKEVDDMVEAIDSTIQQLNNGEWNVKREAGGFSGTSIVVRAVAEVTGKDLATVKAGIEKKLEALKAAGKETTRQALYASFRQNPKIAAVVQRLESEKTKKAASGVDSEELLGELAAG